LRNFSECDEQWAEVHRFRDGFLNLGAMALTGMLVGFGFAQPTLRYLKGLGDPTQQIFSAIQPRKLDDHVAFNSNE